MAKIRKWWEQFTNKDSEWLSLNTEDSVNYWMELLGNYCIDLFEWEGLPDSIPQKEIEKVLILGSGVGAVIMGKFTSNVISGNYWFLAGSESGVTPYDDIYTHFTYGTPRLIGGMRRQNTEKCVVCYNNPLKTSLYPMIRRYAILLANAEVTACVGLINARMSDAIVAFSDSQARTIKRYKDAIRRGATEVIVTDDIMEQIIGNDGVPSLLANQREHLPEDVLKAWEAQNEILRSFFRDIGKRFSKDKKERLVEAEVTADDEMLLMNLNLMEDCRKDFCERVEKNMGMKWSVKLKSKEETEDEALFNLRHRTASKREADTTVGVSE